MIRSSGYWCRSDAVPHGIRCRVPLLIYRPRSSCARLGVSDRVGLRGHATGPEAHKGGGDWRTDTVGEGKPGVWYAVGKDVGHGEEQRRAKIVDAASSQRGQVPDRGAALGARPSTAPALPSSGLEQLPTSANMCARSLQKSRRTSAQRAPSRALAVRTPRYVTLESASRSLRSQKEPASATRLRGRENAFRLI